MKVCLKIICSHAAIPSIKQRIESLCMRINAVAYMEEGISKYWKCENCSVYNIQFQCHNSNIGILESESSIISGGHRVDVHKDDFCVELSCYSAISELVSNPCSAFVNCYITFD